MTERFEIDSEPMSIHVSYPRKMPLDDRYIFEEMILGAELANKVCLALLLHIRMDSNIIMEVIPMLVNYFNTCVSQI